MSISSGKMHKQLTAVCKISSAMTFIAFSCTLLNYTKLLDYKYRNISALCLHIFGVNVSQALKIHTCAIDLLSTRTPHIFWHSFNVIRIEKTTNSKWGPFTYNTFCLEIIFKRIRKALDLWSNMYQSAIFFSLTHDLHAYKVSNYQNWIAIYIESL